MGTPQKVKQNTRPGKITAPEKSLLSCCVWLAYNVRLAFMQ